MSGTWEMRMGWWEEESAEGLVEVSATVIIRRASMDSFLDEGTMAIEPGLVGETTFEKDVCVFDETSLVVEDDGTSSHLQELHLQHELAEDSRTAVAQRSDSLAKG
jgi:hypothetical protein